MNLEIRSEVNKFPNLPGCYIMYDGDIVVYVGKSINLKSRVLSYFDPKSKGKVEKLIKIVSKIEYIVVSNENEALILEEKLIKQYKPRFNVKLKYSNSYPYIEFVSSNGFFKLHYTYKVTGKYDYIGPFTNRTNLFDFCTLINKVFKIRTCSDTEFKARKEPCILYQMKFCTAPCVGYITKEQYNLSIADIKQLFSNKKNKILESLTEKMKTLASEENFEEAALLRDFLDFAGKVNFSSNSDVSIKLKPTEENCFLVDIDKENKLIKFAEFQQGLLVNQSVVFLKEIVINYQQIVEQINKKQQIVFFNHKNFLDYSFESSNIVKSPKKFDPLFLNLDKKADKMVMNRNIEKNIYALACNELRAWLNIDKEIKTIECFDIAIWNGSSPAGSKVVMNEGELNPASYRYYTLTELEEGNNDFAMMHELLERRIKSKDPLPDILLIDGGRPQLLAVAPLLQKYNIKDVLLLGIAKEKTNKEERLVSLDKESPLIITKLNLLKVIVPIRNEAHRFCRKLHHKHEINRIFNK